MSTYSLFIARGILPPNIWEMWLKLRAAVLHYVRETESSSDPEVREMAADNLAEYSALVDEVCA